jgi:ubiquitin-conjugating enzyme E2 S
MKRVVSEIKDLLDSPPEGITVVPNDDDLTELTAIIAGPVGTPFEGGSFKMKLKIGSEFPQAPPKGFFLTKIFHPNVAKNGEICVNTLKKDWKEDLGFRHLLLTVKCLLIVPNPESALNEEAGRLLLENYEEYFRHAKLLTGIHARPSGKEAAPSSTTSKLAESAPSQKPDTPAAPEAKENSDTTNADSEAKKAPQAAKAPAAATQPKKVPALDKKRSLKRL